MSPCSPALAQPALLEFRGVGKTYSSQGGDVQALRDIHLRIEAGEMLAIMGPSGSGKSSFMNLLGCLDVPSSGQYFVGGQDVRQWTPDALAGLRRERFGFVFQRYHLLPYLDALSNVEMPSLYTGLSARIRRLRAVMLLQRLNLSERMGHAPHALSGGQQQRVSIARALVNGADIILADEPTGALDSQSAQDLLELLKQLHAQGHTLIIVTHDAQVAAIAPRVVEISDGRIVRDRKRPKTEAPAGQRSAEPLLGAPPRAQPWAQVFNALRLAAIALYAHGTRSCLSMLGIGIGIACVVAVVSLGEAMQADMQKNFQSLMDPRITVRAGHPDLPAGITPKALSEQDAAALSGLAALRQVRIRREAQSQAQHGRRDTPLAVHAMHPGDLALDGLRLIEGRDLTQLDVARHAQVIVLNAQASALLFEPGAPALGSVVTVANLPFVVVGVADTHAGSAFAQSWQGQGFIAHSTFRAKLGSTEHDQQLVAYLHPQADPEQAQASMASLLDLRRGQSDVSFQSAAGSYRVMGQGLRTAQLVLTAIAAIALLVAGIGVMNMMLVSVSERTSEIGIRMAVGARSGDVQLQFLIEAMALCVAGGVLGLLLCGVLSAVLQASAWQLQLSLSASAWLISFGVSSLLGLLFGWLPARQAAGMSPVQALARA